MKFGDESPGFFIGYTYGGSVISAVKCDGDFIVERLTKLMQQSKGLFRINPNKNKVKEDYIKISDRNPNFELHKIHISIFKRGYYDQTGLKQKSRRYIPPAFII